SNRIEGFSGFHLRRGTSEWRSEVNLSRRGQGQRLMEPTVVVELQVTSYPKPRFSRGRVAVQIDLLILHRPPQPLGEDVVQRSPFPVHADLDRRRFQQGDVLGTGEMAALITIPDRRGSLTQCALR